MWQRFTERARRVIFFAQEEAGFLNNNYVSTEHLLLGLIHDEDTVAARILVQLGVSPDAIRAELSSHLSRDEQRPVDDLQLTPRAKRVIDLSYREAHELDNNYIGTEHLLLGLIREGDGLAGRALSKMGLERDIVRDAVRMLQSSAPGFEPRPQPRSQPLPQHSSVLQAVTAINAYAYGVDTGNWSFALANFSDSVAVDYSAVQGPKAALTRDDLQQYLEQWLGKPELRVHTLLGQLLTNPAEPSEFIVYYTARYFKGPLGLAARYEVFGWFSYRMDGDLITALTMNVSAMEGNPAVLG